MECKYFTHLLLLALAHHCFSRRQIKSILNVQHNSVSSVFNVVDVSCFAFVQESFMHLR